MTQKNKLHYIHQFRGLSILFIVASHIVWSTGDYPEVKHALRLMLNNSTIFFLIISGFLFEHLSNKYKPGEYFIKKIKHILLPYLFCSAPIIIFLIYRFPGENIAYQLVEYIVTGSHLGPYWYIPVIMMFFLISPIIIYIKKFKAFQYALIFTLLYSILSRRPDTSNVLDQLVYYFGFYHLGMVAAMHREVIESWFATKYALIISAVVWGLSFITLILNIPPPPVKTLQILLLGFVLMNVSNKPLPNKLNKLLSLLADYSFGIYFIHQYVINVFAGMAGKMSIDYKNLLYSVAIFPVVILTSVFTIFIFKKILGNKTSRYFIGS